MCELSEGIVEVAGPERRGRVAGERGLDGGRRGGQDVGVSFHVGRERRHPAASEQEPGAGDRQRERTRARG